MRSLLCRKKSELFRSRCAPFLETAALLGVTYGALQSAAEEALGRVSRETTGDQFGRRPGQKQTTGVT